MIQRIARLADAGRLKGDTNGEQALGLVEAIADGVHDLAEAHRNSGFTVDLLVVSDAIHAGLPLDEAAGFLQSLVEAAHVEADLGNVACQFLRWMFEAAVSEFGATRVRSTANEAGHGFSHLAELPSATASQRQKTKIMAKQARRRGLFLPSPDEALATEALGAALDGGGAHAGFAVHWIAGLSGRPVGQYRHFSRKLLTLVETA